MTSVPGAAAASLIKSTTVRYVLVALHEVLLTFGAETAVWQIHRKYGGEIKLNYS